jgi:hypothetical protein
LGTENRCEKRVPRQELGIVMGVKMLGEYMSQDLSMEMAQVDVRGGC